MTYFVEYRIYDRHKEAYLTQILSVKQNNPNLSVLESKDQPGLFLEIWQREEPWRPSHLDEPMFEGMIHEGITRIWRFEEKFHSKA
jgi:hypothetical protein